MKPSLAEYKLFAGIAAYQQKEPDKAIALLENIEPSELNPLQEFYWLTVLERAWASKDHGKSSRYAIQKQAILDKHDANLYYEKEGTPLFEKLDGKR